MRVEPAMVPIALGIKARPRKTSPRPKAVRKSGTVLTVTIIQIAKMMPPKTKLKTMSFSFNNFNGSTNLA